MTLFWPSIGIGMLLVVVSAVSADIRDDFPGPYCATARSRCCSRREDDCSVPISTTLCYCDEFCNDNRGERGDCCPDYESFCLGAQNITAIADCQLHGELFNSYDGPRRDNCNQCECSTDGQLQCERDLCMVDAYLLDNVRTLGDRAGWQARNYTQFWGRKYADGLQLRLGTMEPKTKVKAMTKLSNKFGHTLPREFNAVEHWGTEWITPVRDQGWCGSSWAVSTVSVASDRFAVESKGREAVVLSPQQMLSCVRRQQGCNGGHLDWAWNYFRKVGIVDDECFPYIAGTNRCKVRHSDTLASVGCERSANEARRKLYKVGPAYALRTETDIMLEIQQSGPVQATMRVYRDFFSYSSGIYRHTGASRSEPTGFHSVRLLGWGEENDGYTVTKYWIAANSWGTWWGEDGYFRIVRGENECEIENYVLASWADVTSQTGGSSSYRNPYTEHEHRRQQRRAHHHRNSY